MPFCPNCGSYVSPAANICSCGTTLRRSETHTEKPKKSEYDKEEERKLDAAASYCDRAAQCMDEEDYLTAIDLYTRAIEVLPDKLYIYRKGMACYYAEMYDEALSCFEKSRSYFKDSEQYIILKWIAMALERTQKYDEALKNLHEAIDSINKEYERRTEFFKSNTHFGYENIEKECDDALKEKRENSSEIYLEMALTCWHKGSFLKYDDPEKSRKSYLTALEYADKAIELDSKNDDTFNVKAIILERVERYDEALECYGRALEILKSDIVIKNRAIMIKNWCEKLCDDNELEKASKLIEKVIDDLKSIRSDKDIRPYYRLKERIEEKKELLSEYKFLKNFKREELITITGTQFYDGPKEFEMGTQFSLFGEGYNEYDSDAIGVYLAGNKIGYVANSNDTCADFTSKASEIENVSDIAYAKYLFHYHYTYHIAKIIRRK